MFCSGRRIVPLGFSTPGDMWESGPAGYHHVLRESGPHVTNVEPAVALRPDVVAPAVRPAPQLHREPDSETLR
jgi:hypothetical protein